MKVDTHQHDVERIGVQGEKEFTIKTTAKAFDILSSGIYSDPIMAVIRELSCNAYDAHVEAGKEDTPFEIHLPSKLEPWFSVIDHGIGLDDEDARGLFTTYFDSTKTNTNKQIGAFGLGSKSPFSYTKAFEVICRYNGSKRTYSIFLNEHGVPTIATLANINTDECNGVEVKIHVRDNDFGYFREKTAQCLRYFPVKPIVKGSAQFKFQDLPADVIEGDGYYTWKSKHWNRQMTAVQGNVPYKVDFDQVSDKMTSQLRVFLNKYEMVAFFDIGQLEVAASREEVQYNDKTVKNLIAMMEKARLDFLTNLDKEITKLTKKGSKWELYALLYERFGYSGVKDIAGNFKFSSKMFNEWQKDDGYIVIDAGKYHTIKTYSYGHARAVPRQFGTKQVTGKDGKIIRKLIERPEQKIHVFLNDVTKRSSIRLNSYLRDTSGVSEVIAIAPKSDRTIENSGGTVPTAAQREAEFNAIVKRMGNPTILKLSEETEDVTISGTPRKSGHTFKQYKPVTSWRRNSDRRKPEFNEVSEPSKGGIYIEITLLRDTMLNGQQYNWNDNTFSKYLERMLNIINYVNKKKYKLEDVFGLTKKVVKSVKDDANWLSIEELYKESVDSIRDIVGVRTRINNTEDNIGICNMLSDPSLAKFLDRLDKKSPFRTTIEPAVEAAQSIADATKKGLDEYTINYVTNLNKLVGLEEMDVDGKPFFKAKDFSDYPMVELTGLNLRDSKHTDAVVNYIKLIES